jgi:hypothetical protein
MIIWGWLFVGLLAAILLRQALYTTDDNVAIMTGLLSFGAWGLFAYQSLSVEFTLGGGADPVTRRYPAMALFAVAFGVIGLYIALTGPIAAIGTAARDLTADQQQPPQDRTN